jgi:hypothetical protein
MRKFSHFIQTPDTNRNGQANYIGLVLRVQAQFYTDILFTGRYVNVCTKT